MPFIQHNICSAGDLTQGLVNAKQAIYTLSPGMIFLIYVAVSVIFPFSLLFFFLINT
jgi:hypothetical protein